ncbi:MAG: OmpH family outer membrane protein [Saprospiraceae bacterium]
MLPKQLIQFFLVLVVLGLTFSGCDQQTDAAVVPTTVDTAAAAATDGPRIVFVRADSLQRGYTVIADELTRLQDNAEKAEANIAQRVRALEQEVAGLQNKVQQGLLAPNKIQSEQQRIGRKEQEIMQQRDVTMRSLQEDQLRVQTRFEDNVKAVLEEIQAERNYDYILNQGPGTGVLISNDALDITFEVLKRLNAAETTAADTTTAN